MIANIKGSLLLKRSDTAIVDVGGVGYELTIPLSSYYNLPEPGESLSLRVHTLIKDDSIKLYGFFTDDEKTLFLMLISVNGVGPKLACNILSGISVGDFIDSVVSEELLALTRVPGLGKKTAERLILELKDKVKLMAAEAPGGGELDTSTLSGMLSTDVVSALINLGYKRPAATDAVKKVLKENDSIGFEELLKKTLRFFT